MYFSICSSILFIFKHVKVYKELVMLNMMRIFLKFVVWRYICFFINALSSRSNNCYFQSNDDLKMYFEVFIVPIR